MFKRRITNQNFVYDRITSRFTFGKSYYLAVKKFFDFILLSKYKKNKIKFRRKYNFACCFFMGEKFGLSNWGRDSGSSFFENRVLRKAFGHENEVDEKTTWRTLSSEQFYNLYCSLNIIPAIRSRIWDGLGMHAWIWDKYIKGLVAKCDEKIPLWRSWSRWENNI